MSEEGVLARTLQTKVRRQSTTVKIVFLAYFNGGVRAVDIRDPWSPKEIGYYIPAINENTTDRCLTVDGV